MKKLILFLQTVIVSIGITVLAMMIYFPLTEGRAVDLDLFNIYFDPLIIYGYISSIAFFVALYQILKLLRYIKQNRVFSPSSVKSLRLIKHCAIILTISIVIAGLYIRIFHAKDDDPAGFLAMAIIATLISIIVASLAALFEKNVQNTVDMKLENDLTI